MKGWLPLKTRRRLLPSDARLAAAWQRNEGRTIPADTLLPLFHALSHAAATAGGTFNSRGALNLVTPLARSCPRLSRFGFSNVPQWAQYPAILRPTLPSAVSRSPPPDGSFHRGQWSALLKRRMRPKPACFLLSLYWAQRVSVYLLFSTTSLSPLQRNIPEGWGSVPSSNDGTRPEFPALPGRLRKAQRVFGPTRQSTASLLSPPTDNSGGGDGASPPPSNNGCGPKSHRSRETPQDPMSSAPPLSRPPRLFRSYNR